VKQSNIQAWLPKSALILLVAVALSGCDNVNMPKFNFGKKDKGSTTAPAKNQTTAKLVERDVEAPDVFQVTDSALWDGRPSLGGVWVAYPGNIQPERVIIRNKNNGKFVIGALFKRERENKGPKIQLSSEAADALNILAGKPTQLNITALRRESLPQATPPLKKPAAKKSVAEIATAALNRADGKKGKTSKAAGKHSKPASKPTAKPQKASQKGPQKAQQKVPQTKSATQRLAVPFSSLAKPYIQIGIFSVEKNARNTATSLATQSILPIVKAQQSHGKKFWRVLIGPAATTAERTMLLKKAHGLNFTDAYFVTN